MLCARKGQAGAHVRKAKLCEGKLMHRKGTPLVCQSVGLGRHQCCYCPEESEPLCLSGTRIKCKCSFFSVWDQEVASGKWLLCAFLCLQPQHFQGVDRLRAVLLGRGPKKNRAVPGFFFLLGWLERLTGFLLKSQVWFSEGQLGFPPQNVVAHSGAPLSGHVYNYSWSGHLVLPRQSSRLQDWALVQLADNSGSRQRTLSEGCRKVRQCCHLPFQELRSFVQGKQDQDL